MLLSKRVVRVRPRHLLVCCSRTLWQKYLIPPQISSESWLTQQMVCKYADVNVSQKEMSRAHDTDGHVRLLNNGNSHLLLPRNVWTSSWNRFILLKMLKNSLVKRLDC
jgi:hypothetical protein